MDGATVTIERTSADTKAKGGGELPPPAPADAPAWPAAVLWVLFVAGWAVMPCWWAAGAAGLVVEHDLSKPGLRRRRGLSRAQHWAFLASSAMSVLGVVAIILGLCIGLSKPTALHESAPIYLAISAPAGALSLDREHLTSLRSALHTALGLPQTYPAQLINVWLVHDPAARRRHLLQAGNQVVLLGFTLPQAANVPDDATLAARAADSATASRFATQLVARGFVDTTHASDLAVGLSMQPISANDVAEDGTIAGVTLFGASGGTHVDCVGAWSEWSTCSAVCGSQNRTFVITTPAGVGGAQCAAAGGAGENRTCGADGCVRGYGFDALPAFDSDSDAFMVATELQGLLYTGFMTVNASFWANASANCSASTGIKHAITSKPNAAVVASGPPTHIQAPTNKTFTARGFFATALVQDDLQLRVTAHNSSGATITSTAFNLTQSPTYVNLTAESGFAHIARLDIDYELLSDHEPPCAAWSGAAVVDNVDVALDTTSSINVTANGTVNEAV